MRQRFNTAFAWESNNGMHIMLFTKKYFGQILESGLLNESEMSNADYFFANGAVLFDPVQRTFTISGERHQMRRWRDGMEITPGEAARWKDSMGLNLKLRQTPFWKKTVVGETAWAVTHERNACEVSWRGGENQSMIVETYA